MPHLENVLRAAMRSPWAISPDKLDDICAVLELHANGGTAAANVIAANTAERRRASTAFGGAIAVIPMHGVIAPRMTVMTEMSGGTSCEQLGAQIKAAIENPQVSAIVLDVDSPGGQVAGIQELTARMRAWREIKPITAVSNHLMASAAYCISSGASEIVASPSAEVGSIGVFTIHSDVSQADAVAGVKRTLIKAGLYKAEDLPLFPLTPEAKAHMDAKVLDYYRAFTADVALGLGVSVAAVEAGFGQGLCLTAKSALAAGLIHRIATIDDIIAELSGAPGTSANARPRAIAAVTTPAIVADVVDDGGADDVCPECGGPMVDDGDGIACQDCDYAPTAKTAPSLAAIAAIAELSSSVVAVDSAIGVTASITATATASATHLPTPGDGGKASVKHIPVVHVTAPKAKETNVSDELNASAQTGTDDNAREREILEISALAEQHGMTDQLPRWIGAQAKLDGATGVRAQITTVLRERLERGPVTRTHALDMSAREESSYSYARAILSSLDGTPSMEMDMSQELASKVPMNYKKQGGFFVPTTIRAAGLDSGTATKGAELKFVQYGGFIDMLRNKARVIQAGGKMFPGLDGPVTFTKQNGAGTFAWQAENGGSDVAESNLLLTTVTLTAKTGQSTTSFSRQLLRQSVEDAEGLVRNDLAAVHALGIDLAALAGTGASNQPTGVYNTAGVGVVALGTNGLAPVYGNLINQEVQIGQANADEDIGSGAFITTPGMKGTLQNIARLGNTSGMPIWDDGDIVAGRKGYATNQVQSTLTKGSGTNLHAIYYGIWQQLLIGEWGAMEILVDPLRLKKQGMIEVTSFQMIDIAVRYAAAFSIIKDAISAY